MGGHEVYELAAASAFGVVNARSWRWRLTAASMLVRRQGWPLGGFLGGDRRWLPNCG